MRPFCLNCKQKRATTRKNLCFACWKYEKRTGRNRPRRLWVERCVNCDKPRIEKFSMGRCVNCYQYRLKYGSDRSCELIAQQAPLGWCDCGNAAVRVSEQKIIVGQRSHRYTVTLPLCRQCGRIEEEVKTLSFHGRAASVTL